MSVNIKNDSVCALIKQAAEVSGLSQTSVVERALQQFLEGITRQEQLSSALIDIARMRTDDWGPRARKVLVEMYDDAGLPR